MLDEKDLQAIAQLMSAMENRIDGKLSALEGRIDGKLTALENRIDGKLTALEDRIDEKLVRQKKEILDEATHRMKVLLDAEVTPKFNLLAEGQEDILRRMPSEEDMDIIDGRLSTLEALVKKHSREIAALKQAQ